MQLQLEFQYSNRSLIFFPFLSTLSLSLAAAHKGRSEASLTGNFTAIHFTIEREKKSEVAAAAIEESIKE